MHRTVAISDGDGVIVGPVVRIGEVLRQGYGIHTMGSFNARDPLAGLKTPAAIGAAPQKDIDRSPIAACRLARLGVGEDGPLAGDDNPGDAIRRVAVFARLKEVDLF